MYSRKTDCGESKSPAVLAVRCVEKYRRACYSSCTSDCKGEAMRKLRFALFSAGMSLLFSCSDLTNLTKPESITVKADNARYSFSLGKGTILLRDHLNAVTLQESITTHDDETDAEEADNRAAQTKVAVYDYWPGGESGAIDLQQFLLSYQVGAIPLDFGDYLQDLNLERKINENFSQDINVPQQDVMFTKKLEMPDFDELIRSTFAPKSRPTILVPEGSAETDIADNPDGSAFTIPISAPQFATMEFSDGSLQLTFSLATPRPENGFACTVQPVLVDATGKEITRSATAHNLAAGNSVTFTLPLTDKTITSSLNVKLLGSYGGGAVGNVRTYTITVALSDDSRLRKITGLTMASSALGSNGSATLYEDMPLSELGAFLKKATVDEGELSLSGVLPNGWSGVVCKPSKLAVSDGADFVIKNDDFIDGDDTSARYLMNKYASLHGKRIDSTKSLTLSGELTISLYQATLIFTSGANYSIPLNGTLSLAKLQNALVDFDELLADTDTFSELKVTAPFGTVGSYVQEVVFNQIRVDGSITCDLPTAELLMTPKVTSELFGITNPPLSDTVNVSKGEALSMCTDDTWKGYTVRPDVDAEVDFTVNVALQGNDRTHPSYITVTELELGKRYALVADFHFTYDWAEITINIGTSDDFTFGGGEDDKVETGLNMQSILGGFLAGDQQDLFDNVRFGTTVTKVAAYLCVTRPPAQFNSAFLQLPNFTGTIQADYQQTATGISVQQTPELFSGRIAVREEQLFEADENLLIKKKLFADSSKYSAKLSGFEDVLNDKPSELCFAYCIKPTGDATITLQFSEVKRIKEAGYTPSISITINIVLPLALTLVEDGINIDDVFALAGKSTSENGDLLKRDSADDDLSERFEKYGKIVENIALSYKFQNTMGLTISSRIKLLDDDAKDGKGDLRKEININGITESLILTRDESFRVLNKASYPFQPVISAQIAPGEVYIPRNAHFSAEATLSLILNGEVTVWGDDGA